MQQFKVGDWVINSKKQLTKLTEDDLFLLKQTPQFEVGKELTLWQPKEGEWVVPYNELYKDSFMVAQYNEEEHHLNCEPFIGQLPSFIKEQS